jgi:hypothetical protein
MVWSEITITGLALVFSGMFEHAITLSSQQQLLQQTASRQHAFDQIKISNM